MKRASHTNPILFFDKKIKSYRSNTANLKTSVMEEKDIELLHRVDLCIEQCREPELVQTAIKTAVTTVTHKMVWTILQVTLL